MKKQLLFVLFLLPLLGLFGGTVSLERAENIGRELFSYLSGSDAGILTIEPYRDSASNRVDLYILRFEPRGFVLLAAEEQSSPVLAYSLEADFPTQAMPPHVKWFLSQYPRCMDELRNHPEWTVDPQWAALSRRELSEYQITRDVAPLLSTTWDQDWPYNSMCPADVDGPGGRVYAGCVATAMGQIMKKWNHPTTGSGTHTYTAPGYGSQTANFGNTTYNWANMPNDITSTNPSISTLIYHCSVAVDTQYGSEASGALSEDVRDAMVSHFRYHSNAVFRTASSYTSTAWANLLRGDLDVGRPVYYGGTNGSAGHSFVMDGYQGTNYFHMNWGWSGSYNGYYFLNNLNPNSYNFNLYQSAVTNIYPSGIPAPTPPTNVVAEEVNNNVLLSWETNDPFSRVWRLTAGMEMEEGTWTRLTPGTTSATDFTDNGWATLADGTYVWAVRSVNSAGTQSFPTFSNPLTKITIPETQTLGLAAGWNLVSLNVSPNNHLITSLISGIASLVEQIKGTEGVYIPDNPYSTLTALTDGKAYFIKMSTAAVWSVTGAPIAANTPLLLQDGWNLAAYLPQNSLPTDTAVQNIANWLVQVKGTDGVYVPANPYSTLTSMSPGKGYWIKLNGTHNLVYPAGRAKDITYDISQEAKRFVVLNNLGVKQLSATMTVLAKCREASAGGILLARVQGELRGAELITAPEGIPAALIQVYTETAGEEISFSILKPDRSELPIETTLSSLPQESIGIYPNFLVLELEASGEDYIPTLTKLIGCYPNPFNPSTTISFTVAQDNSQVTLEIYNVRGQRVTTLLNKKLTKGNHSIVWNGEDEYNHSVASGLYFIKMNCDTYHSSLKVLLAK